MMTSDYIVDASEANFEYEVISYSQNLPVVVDFWAPWCVPCRVLGPALEKLAEEGQGRFRLARLNVDENPNLAQRYGVRSIPAVKVFKSGLVASEFIGSIPEPKLREFIYRITPDPGELVLEKGISMLKAHQWRSAEKIFREYLERTPDNTAGQLGLAKSLLGQGRGHESEVVLRNIPLSKEYSSAQDVLPLSEAFDELEHGILGAETPQEAAFRNCLNLAARGNLPSALDGMLDILRKDKHFRGGQLRQVILGLLDLLGEDDPATREYRTELASILF
jgi:putative thioredoxin